MKTKHLGKINTKIPTGFKILDPIERNKVSKEISELKKAKENADAAMTRAKEIPAELKALEEQEAKNKANNVVNNLEYKFFIW